MTCPKSRLLALLLAVVPVSTVGSASASTPAYLAPVSVCAQQLAALPTGRVYGAGDCGDGPRLLVSGPGGAWRTAAALWPGYRVESLAVDGTAAFVVVSCGGTPAPCDAGTPASSSSPPGKAFFIGKVPNGGSRSALTRLGSSATNDSADVVATGGRWFAAWTQTVLDRSRRAAAAARSSGPPP